MKLINPLIILRILSIILLIAGITFLSCIPIALIYSESVMPFLWSSVSAFLIYGTFRIISTSADTDKINTREGYLAVTLSWIAFALIGSLPYLVSGTIIIVLTGIDPVTSASSVATCMAGIGPALGSAGPMSNYAHFPVISKLVLSLLMIIGRLEIITAFALFSKSFWKI